jgi:hypothetical protein
MEQIPNAVERLLCFQAPIGLVAALVERPKGIGIDEVESASNNGVLTVR